MARESRSAFGGGVARSGDAARMSACATSPRRDGGHNHESDKLAILQTQVTPLRAVPEFVSDGVFGFEQGVEAGFGIARQLARIAVFENAPVLQHHHALEGQRLRDVVRDRKQYGVAPDLARAR